MHAGFHSVGLAGRSMLDAIDKVADAGYATIELNAETLPWAQPHVTPATTAAERAAIRDATKRRGIGISAVGAHIAMVEADAAARRAAVAFVNGCTDLAVEVGAPVVHILSGEEPPGIPTAFWRGVGPTHNVYVIESFIDELAAMAKKDPVEYRRAMLTNNPRALHVLNRAVEISGWGKPLGDGRGRGVCVHNSFGGFRPSVCATTCCATVGICVPTQMSQRSGVTCTVQLIGSIVACARKGAS